MVAASTNDFNSDTHWLRSDVDQYLAKTAVNYGVELREQAVVGALERHSNRWMVELRNELSETTTLSCDWIIDATGSADFSRDRLHSGDDDGSIQMHARSTFGHFEGVLHFSNNDQFLSSDPSRIFNPDHAAQHHIIEEGWLWFLRFQCGTTSVGLVTTLAGDLNALWQQAIGSYPTIAELLANATLIDSTHAAASVPISQMHQSKRLARCNSTAVGDGWVSMPNAFGFIDPLHSTGIAHSLTGVLRIALAFSQGGEVNQRLATYNHWLQREVRWIDTLVSLCYAGLPNTQLFMDATAAYFAAVVLHERRITAECDVSHSGFLACDEAELVDAANSVLSQLNTATALQKRDNYLDFRRSIADAIAPYNPIALLDQAMHNRFPMI